MNIDQLIKSKQPQEKVLLGGRVRILQGTVEHWLPELGRLSFDGAVSDPPYHFQNGFMGQEWDKRGVAFNPEIWRRVMLVLKPGAHCVAFGGSTTFHRLMVAMEDGGLELMDTALFLHGVGFPKSLDIGKALDDRLGAVRDKVRIDAKLARNPKATAGGRNGMDGATRPWIEKAMKVGYFEKDGDVPVSPQGKRWNGYGTALKPAFEVLSIFRRPLEGTYAENVLLYDTGGLNINACRISPKDHANGANNYAGIRNFGNVPKQPAGRYPANLILSHHPLCRKIGIEKIKGSNFNGHPDGHKNSVFGKDHRPRPAGGYADADGMEEVERWKCFAGCPIRMLNKQSGVTESNDNIRRTKERPASRAKGGAARFFFTSKVSATERNEGLNEGEINNHPCLKSIDLVRYFATLILPPPRAKGKRRIIVPFAGTGSEIIGAMLAGWDEIVAVEQDPDYVRIAIKRITHWAAKYRIGV